MNSYLSELRSRVFHHLSMALRLHARGYSAELVQAARKMAATFRARIREIRSWLEMSKALRAVGARP